MMHTMQFGRTGHESSRIIFGAAALFQQQWGQDWAEALLDSVVARGVNHIDTAASYGDSEDMLAPWLAATTDGTRNRHRVFLATKTGERSGAAARAELERSLERLGVDSVDLIQLHNLVEEDEWLEAHGADGALAAMTTAREEGLVRHIGVTGHGLRIARMHLRSLDAFDYDSVLLPLNTTLERNAGYADDLAELLGVCAERGVAVQTIKSIARRRWTDPDGSDRRSWYEPLNDPAVIERAMRAVLTHPQVFLNTSSDARLMDEMLGAAERIFAGAGSDGSIIAPDPSVIDADIAANNMQPLFDGSELELI